MKLPNSLVRVKRARCSTFEMLHFADWYRLFTTARVWLSRRPQQGHHHQEPVVREVQLGPGVATQSSSRLRSIERTNAIQSYGNPVSSLGRVRDFDQLFGCTSFMIEVAGNQPTGGHEHSPLGSGVSLGGMTRCRAGSKRAMH